MVFASGYFAFTYVHESTVPDIDWAVRGSNTSLCWDTNGATEPDTLNVSPNVRIIPIHKKSVFQKAILSPNETKKKKSNKVHRYAPPFLSGLRFNHIIR